MNKFWVSLRGKLALALFVMISCSGQQDGNEPDIDNIPLDGRNGGFIAFYSDRNGNSDICAMNTDGTGDMTLTHTGRINENPCWSPSGEQIVFQSDRDSNFEVYKMNADGTHQQRLTNHPIWDGWPSWGLK